MRIQKLARALGWFSVGLGAMELLGGGRVARALGLRRVGLVRLFGARELASGLGIFASSGSSSSLWTRVAGDAIDLAVLARALSPANPKRRAAAVALGNVGAVTALDVYAAAGA